MRIFWIVEPSEPRAGEPAFLGLDSRTIDGWQFVYLRLQHDLAALTPSEFLSKAFCAPMRAASGVSWLGLTNVCLVCRLPLRHLPI